MKPWITRAEAKAFTEKQFDGKTPAHDEKWELNQQIHYGRMEIEELLDQIYGPKEEPKDGTDI